MTRIEFNRLCKGLAATTHVVQWGGSDVWKVGGKVFAICNDEAGPVPGITFKVSDMGYEILKDAPGFRPAPYLASRGLKWVQRYAAPGPSVKEMRAHLVAAHALVVQGLPKKARIHLGFTKPDEKSGGARAK